MDSDAIKTLIFYTNEYYYQIPLAESESNKLNKNKNELTREKFIFFRT